jgi:hypothetical protein
LTIFCPCHAKDAGAPVDSSHAHVKDSVLQRSVLQKRLIIGFSSAMMFGSVMAFSYRAWWQDNPKEERDFHFGTTGMTTDGHMDLDKVGHVWSCYVYYKWIREFYRYFDIPRKTALYASSALSLAIGLSIELGDGVTDRYGFDYQDLLCDLTGLAFSTGVSDFGLDRWVDFKLSFTTGILGDKTVGEFVNTPHVNYNTMIYWLAFKPAGIPLGKIRNRWPGWLNIAVGYGTRNRDQDSHWHLYFDWNIVHFFKDRKFGQLLLNLANILHYPCLGIDLKDDDRKWIR